MLTEEKFKATLKYKGLKTTAQRLAVHEAMMALGHAEADKISAFVKAKGEVRVSSATIYNILKELTDAGIYRCCMSEDNKKYFDVNNKWHIHLYDRVNCEFKDIQDEELRLAIEQYCRNKRFRGYRIDEINISFVCKPARKKKPNHTI